MPQGGLKRVHARLQRAMAAVSKDGRCAVKSILAAADRSRRPSLLCSRLGRRGFMDRQL